MAAGSDLALNNTAVAILLVLNRAPRSGYDVKSFLDASASYFWAASYGRIYPELKRLTDAGLIEGSDEPQGARPKTIYSLTDAGRTALNEWYEREPDTYEMRDEAMLKIFFGEAFERDVVERHIDARRRRAESVLAELNEIEPHVRERGEKEGDPYPHETVRCGITLQESVIAWCHAAKRRRP